MRKEAPETDRLWGMEELERREEDERVSRWKDRRLAQLEREKASAENELAREKVERKQSKLQRLFVEQQWRHREERYWNQLKEREGILERDLRARDDAIRRVRNERDHMAQMKEEEIARRLRAEESLHRCKELMKDLFSDGQRQQSHQPPLEAQFELYEKKWEVLRSGVDSDGTKIRLISFSQIPWPVINMTPTDPGQIQPDNVQEFLMHPLREKSHVGGRERTARMKARDELKRWHSDKFNPTVLSKVRKEDKQAASEVAGMISRVLTDIFLS